jgi:hypothetical protein
VIRRPLKTFETSTENELRRFLKKNTFEIEKALNIVVYSRDSVNSGRFWATAR